jgi:uncharacterized protein YqhQ
MSKSNEEQLYGGQAVIEGVMMRGRRFFAVACRKTNGEIIVESESIESVMKKFQWMNKPFLRGALMMIDTLVLGMKTLAFSAGIAMNDVQENQGREDAERVAKHFGVDPDYTQNPDAKPEDKQKSQPINDIAVGATMVLSLGIGIGVFIIAPHLLAQCVGHWTHRALWLNLAEGGFRLAMFTAYLGLVSLMKDIRRVWQYHGAEHKVINAYEAGVPLVPEEIDRFKTYHPRCGTSFMMFVLIMTIIAYSFLGWHAHWYIRILSRLALLPFIAAVAYEIIRLAGRFRSSALLLIVSFPGYVFQWLTTAEPTRDQVEVALMAFQTVRSREEEMVEAAV